VGATFGAGHPPNQPAKLKVLYHALNTREIAPDPRGESVLPNSWRIVKRSKNGRFDGGQALYGASPPALPMLERERSPTGGNAFARLAALIGRA
jgi:hypothetical protein